MNMNKLISMSINSFFNLNFTIAMMNTIANIQDEFLGPICAKKEETGTSSKAYFTQ